MVLTWEAKVAAAADADAAADAAETNWKYKVTPDRGDLINKSGSEQYDRPHANNMLKWILFWFFDFFIWFKFHWGLPMGPTDCKLTMDKVMAWHHQTNHWLNQCWSRSTMPHMALLGHNELTSVKDIPEWYQGHLYPRQLIPRHEGNSMHDVNTYKEA